MTVEQLIKHLSKFDGGLEVHAEQSDGYTVEVNSIRRTENWVLLSEDWGLEE